MTQNKKVAVIGLGNIGGAIVADLVRGNRPVIAADRTFEKAQALAQKSGSLVTPAEVSAAIKDADIIVLAIYFDPIKAFLKEHASTLQGKIIIDPSNPIALAEGGGFKKIIGEEESAGQILSTQVPEGARLVKAFGSVSAASLSGAAFQRPENAVLFYATDDADIAGDIETLIKDTGFEPVNIGGLDQSIRIEVFGDLHEFGALGKTVTASEAKAKL